MVERTLSMREAVGSMPTFSSSGQRILVRKSNNVRGEKFDEEFILLLSINSSPCSFQGLI